MKNRGVFSGFVFFIFLVSPTFAFGALGGGSDSIDRDQALYKGSKKNITSNSNYMVHEITRQGMNLKEYISNGKVFCLAWQSSSASPDLTILLGTYSGEYQEAVKDLKFFRAPAKVQTNNIVMSKYGHPGDIHAEACVPTLIPKGVKLEDIIP
jgi:hypothetical protein